MKAAQRNLPDALDHVLYEFKMLELTGRRLCEVRSPGETMSVYLESFIIHARCIDEFFCARTDARNKMRPCHFVDDYPCKSEEHTHIRRMHNEVAHLSYDRKRPEGRADWPVKAVALPLFSVCLDFLRKIEAIDDLMAFADNRTRTKALLGTIGDALKGVGVWGSPSDSKATTGFIMTSVASTSPPPSVALGGPPR